MDDKLRDQQTGFRKNRSCTNQIATLGIIIKQCAEWNSSLYVGFIDYEKPLTVSIGNQYGNYYGIIEYLAKW